MAAHGRSGYVLLFVFILFLQNGGARDTILDVMIPGYKPEMDEQYVCTAVEVTKPGYIVEFIPSATADRTHHMLAYGCSDPSGVPGETWDCNKIGLCRGASKIIYAWARNAPPLVLPRGVGVPVGKENGIQYVVLQMHYGKKFGGQVFDNSGVRLRIVSEQPAYLAGIYLFVPFSTPIPPNTRTYFMNATCEYEYQADVHPFAFRPHAHNLGRVISSYKYSVNGTWTKIGKGNPLWPQRFYPIDEPVIIKTGDILAAQCVFDSTDRDEETHLGMHGHDEMCNFYMYYYVDAKDKAMMDQFSSCGMNEREDLFASYPAEASTRFAPNPDMEETAKLTDTSFAVLEKAPWPWPNITFGQIAGLARDKKGNVVVFHRADRVWGNATFDFNNNFMERDKGPITADTVITLAQDGSVVSRWGSSFFYLPHGVFIDDRDFIWLTDVAMHQVFKFDPTQKSMKPLLVLGKAFEPGTDEQHFCKPAAVAVAAEEGTIFVADGYCNSRIMKFGPDGKFLQTWGEASRGVLSNGYPKLATFSVPHGLSLDDGHRRLFVADRENGRVQFFTFDGTGLGQLAVKEFGDTVYGITYCPKYDIIFVINGPSFARSVDIRAFAFDGSTQRLMYSFKPQSGELQRPHAVVSSSDCSHIFVGEIGPNKLWQFDIVSSGRRASTGVPAVGTNPPKSAASHKPQTATDADQTKPGDQKSVARPRDLLKLIGILFVAIMTPILLIICVCCCIRCKKQGALRGKNLTEYSYGTKKGLFGNGYRDHMGFKPLSTEDVDASDESDSDAEHTLYLAQRDFGSRKA